MYTRYIRVSHIAFLLDISAKVIKKFIVDNDLYCSKGKINVSDLDMILTWHFREKKKVKYKLRQCSDIKEIRTIFARLEEEVTREFDYVGQIADNMSSDRESSFIRHVIWYLAKMNTTISVEQIAHQYNYTKANVYQGIRKIKDQICVYRRDRQGINLVESIVF